jgi:hypothetical protein
MTIKEIKKSEGLTDRDIAKAFGYANANSYRNAKDGKKRLDAGLEWFYQIACKANEGGKEN